MEINVSVGEWMNTLKTRMENATDGDCFHLPTQMHHHAFTVLKEDMFPNRKFNVIISNNQHQ